MGEGWSVAEVVCSHGPGDRPYEEQHHLAMLAVVLRGSFKYRAAAGTALLSPGALMLGWPKRSFECSHEHGVGDHCLSFHFAPEYLERIGVEGWAAAPRIPPLAALAPGVARARVAAARPAGTAWEELGLGLVAAALQAVPGPAARAGRRPPSAADERRVSLTLRAIEADLDSPLKLETLAGAVKMSPFHFLRVFRQVVGVTPRQYIVRSRLREAAARLRTGAAPVQQVALEAGYGDLSHFHHAFAAEFGTSPRGFH
ncbi:MAG: helix-turn-helix transcriptional regulator [Terriglobales bacterium]